MSAIMRQVRADEGAAILDDFDRHVKPLDGSDYFAIERSIAVHMRRCNEEIRMIPVASSLQAAIGDLLER